MLRARLLRRGPDGALALQLPFVVSTWNPYNVVLLTARVRLDPIP